MMVLQVLRALFVLLMAAVGWFFLSKTVVLQDYTWLTLSMTLTLGVLVVCLDILAPRRKLQIVSGTFLGLIVGILITYALSFVVKMLVDQYMPLESGKGAATNQQDIVRFVDLILGMVCCYLSISFVLQTKDDFRFIVPYVEFSKQTKGARPMLLDTSMLIDGRIIDILATGIVESQLIVPRFVVEELQAVADSEDKLKRSRGRRGLDVLTKLRESKRADLVIYDSHTSREERGLDVDNRLVALAKNLSARVLTTDFNLNKVAQLSGVDVININDLSNSLKPVVLPGEKLAVRLINPGEGESQAVGYLEDGTMVVVEQARQMVGQDVEITVSRVIQTSAGRMIFGRLGDAPQETFHREMREPRQSRRRGAQRSDAGTPTP